MAWESFTPSGGGPAFFYPAAGVTVAALMLNRRALWPWIVAAIIAAEMLVDTLYGNPLWVSAGFAAANTVEPLVGASLVLATCGGLPDLRKRWDLVVFILAACVIAPTVSAPIGGSVIAAQNGIPWLGSALSWWAGDALGVLVMASPILLWNRQSASVRRRPWETAAVLLGAGLFSVATFWTDFPPTILLLPVLAWAAFRLDMLGAAMGGAVAAFLANVMSTRGLGLFITTNIGPEGRVVLTQIYIAVIVVVAMLIAQEAGARANAVQERRQLEALSVLALQLSAALTPEDIGEALKGQVLKDAGARALALCLLSTDGERMEILVSVGYPRVVIEKYNETGFSLTARSVATDVVRSGVPVEYHSRSEYFENYPELSYLASEISAGAIVGWPLSSGGKAFGSLLMLWSDQQPLDGPQRAYISAVATMVSQALVRAKVYVDERARAAVLHSVAQPTARVDVVGLDYRALYRPADVEHGLGGDWYSVMALPDNRTYLSVGDVMGHGLLSVEDMAVLRSSGNAYAHLGLSAAQVLTELNRLAANQIRGEFATNLIAIYDPDYSSLSYCSAGHLPAILRRADTGEVVLLNEARGPILGPFEDSLYVQAVVPVSAGDVLIMYTDGLVEHHDQDVRTGIRHLADVVAAWPPEALLDCAALAGQVAPSPYTDDVCLLAVRFGMVPGTQ